MFDEGEAVIFSFIITSYEDFDIKYTTWTLKNGMDILHILSRHEIKVRTLRLNGYKRATDTKATSERAFGRNKAEG